MNVIDYSEANLHLTVPLIVKLCEADAKYIRFTLSQTGNLEYRTIEADQVDINDYVIRLDRSSNLVLTSRVYSKILGMNIGVTEGLRGTELVIT